MPTEPFQPTTAGDPPRPLRLLCLAGRAHANAALARALAAASRGSTRVTEAVGEEAGVRALSDSLFDAVCIHHEPDSFDGLAIVRALRGAGHDLAIIVLAEGAAGEFETRVDEAGANAFCSLDQCTAASLLCVVRRAAGHARLAREYRRLADAEQRRLASEHQEADRLLGEQRRLVTQLEALGNHQIAVGSSIADAYAGEAPTPAVPDTITTRYRELLQTYVVMGAGSLATEIAEIAGSLIEAGVTGRRATELHVSVVERVVAGLGARSARHVMTRADLLLVELLVNLADGYRRRYDQGTEQQSLQPPPRSAA